MNQPSTARHDVGLAFPAAGLSMDEVEAALLARNTRAAEGQRGRMFTSYYSTGDDDVVDLATRAASLHLYANALHSATWPEIKSFADDLIRMSAELFHGPDAVGTVNLGGSEGIFCVIKAARDQARIERGLTDPEIIVPRTAYPAFGRAAHYLGVRIKRIAIDSDFRADLDSLRSAITKNTILVAGSAPNLPMGVVDPIRQMAAITFDAGINFHVDASIGGFQLPFLRRLGVKIPDFDFLVPGVTSITACIHKFGYSPPGAGIVLYRDERLYRYQEWQMADWAMGVYRNQNMMGTQSGAAIAAAWAVFNYLGQDGFLRLTTRCWNATQQLIQGVNSIGDLQVYGRPESSSLVFGSQTLDSRYLCEGLRSRGWVPNPRFQTEPDGVHLIVSPIHDGVVDEFISDLKQVANTDSNLAPTR